MSDHYRQGKVRPVFHTELQRQEQLRLARDLRDRRLSSYRLSKKNRDNSDEGHRSNFGNIPTQTRMFSSREKFRGDFKDGLFSILDCCDTLADTAR